MSELAKELAKVQRSTPCAREPDLFFTAEAPGNEDLIELAKAHCMFCPVKARCLALGMELNDQWAIYGGTTPKERNQLRQELEEAA